MLGKGFQDTTRSQIGNDMTISAVYTYDEGKPFVLIVLLDFAELAYSLVLFFYCSFLFNSFGGSTLGALFEYE